MSPDDDHWKLLLKIYSSMHETNFSSSFANFHRISCNKLNIIMMNHHRKKKEKFFITIASLISPFRFFWKTSTHIYYNPEEKSLDGYTPHPFPHQSSLFFNI